MTDAANIRRTIIEHGRELDSIKRNPGLAQIRTETAVLDFGSISTNDEAELTVTVTGARENDIVSLGPPSTWETGVEVFGFVSADDTVTVRASNNTGGNIDPASQTFRVLVFCF